MCKDPATRGRLGACCSLCRLFGRLGACRRIVAAAGLQVLHIRLGAKGLQVLHIRIVAAADLRDVLV